MESALLVPVPEAEPAVGRLRLPATPRPPGASPLTSPCSTRSATAVIDDALRLDVGALAATWHAFAYVLSGAEVWLMVAPHGWRMDSRWALG